MIINHNLSALNAWRALSINTTNTQKVLEKLSSGYRINRAGDDAAGLAISEKMRSQIRGLSMAQRNAQDGISLIQTAEGALNETHAILQRMAELAVQAANGTNTDDDRAAIQKEIDQLAQELGRIGRTTEFNTQKLLDGTFESVFHIGANENQNLSLTIEDMRGAALGVVGKVSYDAIYSGTYSADDTTTDPNAPDFTNGTYTVSYDSTNNVYQLKDSAGNVVGVSSDGKTWVAGTDTTSTTAAKLDFTTPITSGTIEIDTTKSTATATVPTQVDNVGLDAGTYRYYSSTGELKNSSGEVIGKSTDGKTFVDLQGNTLFTLGAAVTVDTTFTVGGIDVTTQSAANVAITKIQKAVDKVSSERSKLGAYQNRLEHTINNLGTALENLTAAESRIRDVDMAQAMMEFTKNNILNQAATAMLAQANQLPQTILQLLR